MFLSHVNNREHNLKQNIYTGSGMEVIALLPSWYCTKKQQEWKYTDK